jgi:hypothetical protein
VAAVGLVIGGKLGKEYGDEFINMAHDVPTPKCRQVASRKMEATERREAIAFKV